MNRRTFCKALPATLPTVRASGLSMAAFDETSATGSGGGAARAAADLESMVLPKPETEGGKSVLAALRERRTIRSIKEDRLTPQVLSDLLWAALSSSSRILPVSPRPAFKSQGSRTQKSRSPAAMSLRG